MIRHLRSCHVQEYQQVQEARQSTLILKMEEKARAQLLREMNTQVASTMVAHIAKKTSPEPQKSPSASSSASDTASSVASSLFGPVLPPPPPLSIAPAGLPAPKPVKIFAQPMAIKQDATEVEDDVNEPTDLSAKTSAFAALGQKKRSDEVENEIDQKAPSTPRHFTLRNVDERKINAQIAMMMLIDQIPSKIVDGHGFRSLMSFLLPDYPMPSAELFESTICPEVITQIQPHLANLFSTNNPLSDPFESLMQVLKKRQGNGDDCHTVNFDGNVSKSSKRDEDSDSSCSVEVESALSPQIEAFTDYVGRFSFAKDELHSLLTVCHSVFGYFEDRPALMTELSLTTPTLEPTQPQLLRDVLFVAEHADRINAYIRATPDMALLPISDAQFQTLTELVRLVRKI
nr:C. briggsae CBR-ZBED-6 protein [Haemonchus contortus]